MVPELKKEREALEVVMPPQQADLDRYELPLYYHGRGIQLLRQR